MIQACNKCHRNYDNEKQRSDCPHLEFPKMCNIHQRYNCGSHQCTRGTLLEMNKRERNVKAN